MSRWRRWCLFMGVSVVAACSKPNPAATCQQGTCIDPSFPYCDADGSIGGTPGECIAVTCTANEFGKCSGDSSLICNQYGTGYDQVDCAHGCDDATGCKLCEANQTVCANGAVATCDGAGNQTSVTQCPLGCFEDQPRCRDIDPSNRLATYFDMALSSPDLDLAGSWNVDTDTGVIQGATTVSPLTFVVPSADGGPTMRVYVVGALNLGDVSFNGTNAAVFLASKDVTVTGDVAVLPGVGASRAVACRGQSSTVGNNRDRSCADIPPGGGGGATAGASSGMENDPDGSLLFAGGPSYGTDDLQPLVGGCSGGGTQNPIGTSYPEGSAGGGALQISSRSAIMISGSIHVDGRAGGSDGGQYCEESFFGAGGGGGLLLEAPKVTFAATAVVSAVGGDGIGCAPAQSMCGLPGTGGDGTMAATSGGDITWTYDYNSQNAPFDEWVPGGGGGGAGRIRINTPTGGYTADSTATIKAVRTTGVLRTR